MDFSEPTRRRALWALGAAGLGVIGAGDTARVGNRPRSSPPGGAQPHPVPVEHTAPAHRDPGWTQEPLRALHRPVRSLDDLAPAAPPESIALTIDDGPHPEWTPRILDLLAEHQVPASFCLIGEQVKDNAKLVRRMVDSGHQICNHTMTHPAAFAGLSTKEVRWEVTHAHARISEVTGVAPKFFRSPGGVWSPKVLDCVAEHDMLPIGWSIDPRDWSLPGTAHIKVEMLHAKKGAIILCHDGGGDRSQTLRALRTVIPKLKKRGLTFVAL